MASSVATDKMACNLLVEMWDHDPGTTAAKVTSPDGGTTERWVDLRDYDHFAVAVMGSIFGDSTDITLVEIVASDSEDENDGSVTQVKTSGVVAVSAIGDWIFLECSAEEVAHLAGTTGYDLRYVAARITCGHAGHEAVVTYLANPRRPHDAVTAATTIA